MLRSLLTCILVQIYYLSQASASYSYTYTTENLEKTAIIISLALIIFSPKKSKGVVIGTIAGLTLAYLTYKYVVPAILP